MRYGWAGPATVLGLAIALLALVRGGRARPHSGVLEISGGFARHLLRRACRASAMTLGHVVLGVDEFALDDTRDHERVHVRQYERWGPLFIPLYLASSLFAWLRGKHPYFDNVFEREAFDLTGW